ncbi:hypothetical protein Tco_0732406 [Tanacetum coccineum]
MTNGNPSSVIIKQHCGRSYALSWKPCQGDSLNLPDHRIHKDGDGDASFQLKSDSLPHAHAQSTKTFYKHQDSRIMKAQELKTKTSAQTLIYKIFLQRYQVYQGRLLASFQDDAKYEHVGQDTRSQGGKDDQDKQGKDLKISDIKTKSKDNDKGSRSKITKHEGTSLQRIQRPRPQDLNDKSNLIDLMKECHNELTLGEIVSLKILSRTRKFITCQLSCETIVTDITSVTTWLPETGIKAATSVSTVSTNGYTTIGHHKDGQEYKRTYFCVYENRQEYKSK